jgi:hypothetical protein
MVIVSIVQSLKSSIFLLFQCKFFADVFYSILRGTKREIKFQPMASTLIVIISGENGHHGA